MECDREKCEKMEVTKLDANQSEDNASRDPVAAGMSVHNNHDIKREERLPDKSETDMVEAITATVRLQKMKFLPSKVVFAHGHVCGGDESPIHTCNNMQQQFGIDSLSEGESCHIFFRNTTDVNILQAYLEQQGGYANAGQAGGMGRSLNFNCGKPASTKISTRKRTSKKVKTDGLRSCFLRLKISRTKAIERNRKGAKLLECLTILSISDVLETLFVKIDTEKIQAVGTAQIRDYREMILESPAVPIAGPPSFIMHDKKHRHVLFANWLIQTYGKKYLSTGSGVLDVAGGKGELCIALVELGIPVVLLDPDPRLERLMAFKGLELSRIPVIKQALTGDGSNLMLPHHLTTTKEQELLRTCSMIVGMHPDSATEAIIDMSQQLMSNCSVGGNQVPFALLPCCVMPSLFPKRMYLGQPVRAFRTFCQYLHHKCANSSIQMQEDHLAFMGRNLILFTNKLDV